MAKIGEYDIDAAVKQAQSRVKSGIEQDFSKLKTDITFNTIGALDNANNVAIDHGATNTVAVGAYNEVASELKKRNTTGEGWVARLDRGKESPEAEKAIQDGAVELATKAAKLSNPSLREHAVYKGALDGSSGTSRGI